MFLCFMCRSKFIAFAASSGSFWTNIQAFGDCLRIGGWLGTTSASIIAFSVFLELLFPAVLIVILFSPFNFFSLALYLEPKLLVQKSREIALVCLLSAVQPLLIVFLPWEDSLFCQKSGGYPNVEMFRLLNYSEALLNIFRVIAILMSRSYQSSAMSILALLFSSLLLILTSLEIAVKLKGMEIALIETVDIESRKFQKNKNNIEMYAEDIAMDDTREKLKENIEDIRFKNRDTIRMSSFSLEDSVLDKSYTSSDKYADENLQILKSVLEDVGVLNPPRYIPLHEIEAELAQLTAMVNAGESFDEKRLDYLLQCMEINPDYRVQQEERNKIEREEMSAIVQSSLETMQSIVPPNIAELSVNILQRDYNMSAVLAKRLVTKKCLWLVHMSEGDIMKLHEADLTGRYGYGAQNLDIVERMAVYACMPNSFLGDSRGVKKRYVADLEQSVKQMLRQQNNNSLPKSQQRNPAYKDVKPYAADGTDMTTVSSDSTGVNNPIHNPSSFDV